jgi:predicted transcriptional regulator
MAKKAAGHGIEREHDLPWNDKKVAIFKALKALGATSAASAKSASEVAKKAGVTERDVRHYTYHAKAAGLTGVVSVEGARGYAYHLTAKGAKLNPATKLKAQQAAKGA